MKPLLVSAGGRNLATGSDLHVEVEADGAAFVAGPRTKGFEIALDRLVHPWDAEKFQRQHPHLSLGERYAIWS